MGPGAALHAIVDRIVDAYEPVVDGVLEDIEEVEAEVFSSEQREPGRADLPAPARGARVRARGDCRSAPALRELAAADVPNIDPQLVPYFRDVADHAVRVGDQIEGFGTLLAGVLQANLTQVTVRQNEDMRRISAWVAIIAVPTAVAGIYGMNFEHMPELGWRFGYPAVLLLILVVCVGLYVRFRRVGLAVTANRSRKLRVIVDDTPTGRSSRDPPPAHASRSCCSCSASSSPAAAAMTTTSSGRRRDHRGGAATPAATRPAAARRP